MSDRPIKFEEYGGQTIYCEWGGCEHPARWFRDTTWGDLAVCVVHRVAPLDPDNTGDEPRRQPR